MRDGTLLPSREEGKGQVGCMLFLLLLAVSVYVGIKVWPDFYAHKSFEAAVKTEMSRAGANFHSDETVLRNILALASRNEIRLSREDVKLERFASQIFVTVRYTIPVDLIVYNWIMSYEVKASSFVGRI